MFRLIYFSYFSIFFAHLLADLGRGNNNESKNNACVLVLVFEMFYIYSCIADYIKLSTAEPTPEHHEIYTDRSDLIRAGLSLEQANWKPLEYSSKLLALGQAR